MKAGPLLSSVIAPELIAAYCETDYRVDAVDAPFALRIGQSSPELRALLRAHHADCAAFLTACNPGSVRCSDVENDRVQAALRDDLRSLNLIVFGGVGQDASAVWPGESSFLVLDLDLDGAKKLAGKYRQNAFVWVDSSGVPELILMR